MLPKPNRLPSSDFRRVLKSGKRIYSQNLILIMAERKLSRIRVGFIVSLKFDKRATARNRAKRLMREAVRVRINEIKPGYDLIFSLKTGAGLDFKQIEAQIKELLIKVQLLNAS